MYFDRQYDYYYLRWAEEIKQRDRFTCQICKRRGGELNAHHMNAWNVFPKERYDLRNGITLCRNCHNQFHDLYGYGDNTKLQFAEYRLISEVILDSLLKKSKVEQVTREIISELEGKPLSDEKVTEKKIGSYTC